MSRFLIIQQSMKLLFSIFCLFTFLPLFAGKVINSQTREPIGYVNIGILGFNHGTVSDFHGNFTLKPNEMSPDAVVKLSCIGYEPLELPYHQFIGMDIIELKEVAYPLREKIVLPSTFVKKVLGVKATSKAIQAGFENNALGHEMGIMMSIRKRALINSISFNVAGCTFDTVFYRVNIYEVRSKSRKDFFNVLQEPVYLTIPKEKLQSTVVLDLSQYQIITTGNILVTLEHIKDLGAGRLYFCSQIGTSTWYRKTSQGKWESAPIGISVSIEALVEK